MKKHILLLILTTLVLTLSSWTVLNSKLLNANSWAISIGKKELLASWKKNKMGDIAAIEKNKTKSTDTLFAQRYLCGYSGQNSITTLTIKNQQNEIINESTNRHNGFMFKAKMSLADILKSPGTNNSQILTVYFTIKSDSEKIDQTVLLGRLKLN